jgi:hypothetical protein
LPLCLCLGSDRPDPAAPARNGNEIEAFKDDGVELPRAADLEALARNKPIAFFEACLRRTVREVKGFTTVMEKQERLAGKIYPREIVDVACRQDPFSVYMEWKDGVRLADRVLFVAGENDGKMLARPHSGVARFLAGSYVVRDVDGPDARQSSRETLREFGFRHNMEETYHFWKAARDAGTFHYDYQGIKKVKEVGDRTCFTLHRVCDKPELDGVKDVTIYVDTETWLQVGSVMKDTDGLLIAAYYFRDVKLNPEFKKDQFKPAAME